MRVALGGSVVATLQAPSEPPARMGARIEVPYTGEIAAFWQEAVLDTETNIWTAVLETPVLAGDYLIVWVSGIDEGAVPKTYFPLAVDRPGPLIWPNVIA